MSKSYADRLARGRAQHGDNFDPSELDSADDSIRDAYTSGLRVKVRNRWTGYERTGIVSTTTGWRPAFLLMHRAGSHGSSDVISSDDRVIATWRGRSYVPGTPYGREMRP